MIIIYICVFVVCIIYCDSTGALLLHCCCIAATLPMHYCCLRMSLLYIHLKFESQTHSRKYSLLLSQDVSFAHSSQI